MKNRSATQQARNTYQTVKTRAKARSAAVPLAGQDIGGLPPIADRVCRGQARPRPGTLSLRYD